MRKRMHVVILSLLILSTDSTLGKSNNKTKPKKPAHFKHNAVETSPQTNNVRLKRSIDEDRDKPLWSYRAKTDLRDLPDDDREPFWALRGRRDSSSIEHFVDLEKPPIPYNQNDMACTNCFAHNSGIVYGNMKHAREDMSPFWGNRGRRSSEESDNMNLPSGMYWSSRGRRQENEPFWGNRGRRDEERFWGSRGRREEEPFWGNRGRRQEEPFWGNRGRRNSEELGNSKLNGDDSEPFWGNRGRRDDSDPFWGNRGRRRETEAYWTNRAGRQQHLKDTILSAINDVENLSRLRRSSGDQRPFWSNRSRESKLKHLFNGSPRMRPLKNFPQPLSYSPNTKSSEPGTVLDNKMYAEEPHYILVERNSRSSSEDDPYYISRGKKYYLNLEKAGRDRRGAIEEIVKSVRNDPFYIARGKKDFGKSEANTTAADDQFAKTRDLICSAIDLVIDKSENARSKRDIPDSERDRRTILKKLAAQLQMDPYFVSRGKKSDSSHNKDGNMEDFVKEVASKCYENIT